MDGTGRRSADPDPKVAGRALRAQRGRGGHGQP